MATMVEQICHCGKKFQARAADVKRGWGKCCSKSCAAHIREYKLDRNGYRSMHKKQRRGVDLLDVIERKVRVGFVNVDHDDDPSWDAHKSY